MWRGRGGGRRRRRRRRRKRRRRKETKKRIVTVQKYRMYKSNKNEEHVHMPKPSQTEPD